MQDIEVYCDSCDQPWRIYHRAITHPDSRICPHCGAKIPPECYEKIVRAAAAALDANKSIEWSSVTKHTPRFTVDFIDTCLYGPRYRHVQD